MQEKQRLQILLKRLKQEDMSAFDEFYLLSKKPVYFAIYVIFKDDHIAQDLSQEVYLDFLNYKSKLKDDIDIIAYLVTSAKNKAINYYNKVKYEQEFKFKFINESYSKDEMIESDLIDKIKDILDEKEFMVFTLKVLGDYTFKEISKLKDIPIGTLTWLYSQAKEKLQLKLGGYL